MLNYLDLLRKPGEMQILKLAKKNNVRDFASISELTVLSD